jgi:hypothetical protein
LWFPVKLLGQKSRIDSQKLSLQWLKYIESYLSGRLVDDVTLRQLVKGQFVKGQFVEGQNVEG